MTKIDPYLQTALDLIADNGWTEFTLADLAKRKKVKLATVHSHFPNRLSVIESFAKLIDQTMLDTLESFSADESSKDRLFAVMMTRFDVLNPYRGVIKSLWQEGWKDPLLMMSTLPQGLNSMSLILQAANIDTTGFLGSLRIKSFTLFYLNTVWTWLHDETEYKDETMAALDKGLSRLSQFPGFYN